MAELLVKAVNATHANPQKNAVGCYKRGDIVLAMEDGHRWGTKELLAPAKGGVFVIIKIPGVTVDQLQRFVRERWDWMIDAEDEDEALGFVRRRRFRIDADLLPAGVRSTLNTTGQYTTTWAQIRQFLRNKRNNETAEGRELPTTETLDANRS